MNTGDIPVVLTGSVQVQVSSLGGPIHVGDEIGISSSTPGIGVHMMHQGYTIGNAVEPFDPANGLGLCQEGATSTGCTGLITVQLVQGWSAGNTGIFQIITESVTDVAQAVLDLTNGAFTKGAQYTKLAVGKIIAQTAVVKDFFAQVLTILPGGSLKVPSGSNQIAGSDTIPVGGTTYFVANTNVTQGAKIFITPRVMTAIPISVTDVQAGGGFTVTLAGQAPVDIPFDWLMVSTYQVGTAAAALSNPPSGGSGGVTSPAPSPSPVTPPTDPQTGSSTPPTDTGSSTPPVDDGSGTSTPPTDEETPPPPAPPEDTGSSTPPTP